MDIKYFNESIDNETQVYINSFFILAKNNIEDNLVDDDFQEFRAFSLYSNFWTNFSLNFKDDTYVEAVMKNELNLVLINKILSKILDFLSKPLTSIGNIYKWLLDVFQCAVGKKNSKFGAVILIFYQLFLNLKQSKLSDLLIVKNKLDLEDVFENYMKFSKINLKNFLDLIYEKEGYSFLDFKGNICKDYI